MGIIGIDPAGSDNSRSYCFDGETFYICTAQNLSQKLLEWKQEEDVLVCWDSPLTATRDRVHIHTDDFSQRCIEKIFKDQYRFPGVNARVHEGFFLVPPGISVQNYTGVSHWAISQFLLGYPEVGGCMGQAENHPYELVANNIMPRPIEGYRICEVHPAVAMWWWISGHPVASDGIPGYRYKSGSNRNIHPTEMWQRLLIALEEPFQAAGLVLPDNLEVTSDGKLDAVVAYILGYLYQHSDAVSIVGSLEHGAMLLPADMQVNWNQFVENGHVNIA